MAAAIGGVLGLVSALNAPAWAQQPAAAPGSESDLIAVLRAADAASFAKAKACQQLALVGTKTAVPALAEMLGDQAMAHYARFALEAIPDPAVDQALREALEKQQGELLIGVIDSIGRRQDPEAVPALVKLLEANGQPAVAGAAAAALGRIASPVAVAALKGALDRGPEIRQAVADACFAAADRLRTDQKQAEAVELYDAIRGAEVPSYVKIAALQNVVPLKRPVVGFPLVVDSLQAADEETFRAGLAMSHEWPGTEINRVLTDELARLQKNTEGSEVRQALLITTLGDRGARDALPVVLEQARQGKGEVQLAALRVLGRIGDESVLPFLVETAASASVEPAAAETALESLTQLKGEGVDQAVAAQLGQSQGKRLGVLIEVAGRRGIASAAPTLLAMLESGDSQVREAAISALGLTAGMDEMPTLLDRMVGPKAAEVGPAAKAALLRAVARVPERDACAVLLIKRMEGAPAAARSDLMDLLAVTGGEKALEAVGSAAKSGSDDDQNAATRVLGAWMTPDAAPVLLELATDGPDKYRIRTLRGYLRIARQLDVPTPERLAMCERALEAATRKEEKALALEILGRNPSGKSLGMVVPYLDQKELQEAAALAVVAMAEKDRSLPAGRVKEALEKVAATTTDEVLKARARAVLDRNEKP